MTLHSPPHNPLQAVRDSCAYVAKHASHIELQEEKLSAYCQQLPLHLLSTPDDDPARSPLETPDQTALFLLTLNAINFGSGSFPHLHKLPNQSGYHTVATLWRSFHASRQPSLDDLCDLSHTDVARILHQSDNTSPVIHQLMTNFARSLRTLCTFIRERHRDARSMLAHHTTAVDLTRTLAGLAGYDDVCLYKNTPIYIYKRAQITCTDLALCPQTRPLFNPDDLDQLTIFADNLVPHVLHTDGILVYSQDLRDALERGEPIRAGSSFEVELRACAVHACERIVEFLRQNGTPITARDLDIVLWRKGQERVYWGPARHRCVTMFY